MELPNKERTFDFNYVGEDTGKSYDGRFTVRCLLNVGQKHLRDLEETRLLGNYPNPTNSLAGFAVVLANLRAKVVDGPEWWKQSQGGTLIEDEGALVTLYQKVQEAEMTWREELNQKTKVLKDPSSPS